MAISKTLLASLLLSLLYFALLIQFDSLTCLQVKNPVENSVISDGKIDCGKACAERCKLSSRPNLCKRACGTCCSRCSCVPPGTYNNYDACPCYRDMTTHGGRHKCP
ncbi:Snakin-2 [Hibiscus syriacus]|uniref:Snakin-2 n=1 Tax=Hibiscus syriacus TaxID=106335 RepID=A0A6A2WX37_HIBSY|nr:Snakin-2 [Hibiscus syriacus]